MKYYLSNNASRKFKANGYTFAFEVVEQFAGSWRGVLKLEHEEEIKALESFAASVGIKELTEAEYQEQLKKKVYSKPKPSPSQVIHPPSQLPDNVGVVLKNGNPTPQTKAQDKLPEVDALLNIGTATFVDPVEIKAARSKKKK